MTAKEFVLTKMPRAKSEKHKTNGKESYWLIRDGRDSMWFASGDTESKAWKEAKERILEQEAK